MSLLAVVLAYLLDLSLGQGVQLSTAESHKQLEGTQTFSLPSRHDRFSPGGALAAFLTTCMPMAAFHAVTSGAYPMPRFKVDKAHTSVFRICDRVAGVSMNGDEIADEPSLHLSADVSSKSFADLLPDLPPVVMDALAARGICKPTPIQQVAMEKIFNGESLMLNAETGSGKSLAFLLPVLLRLGLAGLEEVPVRLQKFKVLVAAPTRELAVQLANEAAMVLPAPGAVQIVAMGARPHEHVLAQASVITFTFDALMDTVTKAGGFSNARSTLGTLLDQAHVLVLDELDKQMPVEHLRTYTATRDKRKATKKNTGITLEEEITRRVLESNLERKLQVIAASATISKQSQMKLSRILRKDPIGRFYNKPPPIIRPENIMSNDLSALPRAVVVPSSISHYYVRIRKSAMLKQMTPQLAPSSNKLRLGTLSVKQQRQNKIRARDLVRTAAEFKSESEDRGPHPLLMSFKSTVQVVKPASALVFLCRSTGLTVRSTVRELKKLGLNVKALHEVIGLEHGMAEEEQEEANDDPTLTLQRKHREISQAFHSQIENRSDDATKLPLLVTFEDMARGLHFDAVEAVFILGIPDSPQTYLHLAGRTGRQPVLKGTVVTICPGKSHEKLKAWSNKLGDVQFEELILPDGAMQEDNKMEAVAR